LFLAIHPQSLNPAIQTNRNRSIRSQETEKVPHDCNRFLQTHATHPFTQVPNESFQIAGRHRRESIGLGFKLQPGKEFDGNLTLTTNRGWNVSSDLLQVHHESIYVGLRLAGREYNR